MCASIIEVDILFVPTKETHTTACQFVFYLLLVFPAQAVKSVNIDLVFHTGSSPKAIEMKPVWNLNVKQNDSKPMHNIMQIRNLKTWKNHPWWLASESLQGFTGTSSVLIVTYMHIITNLSLEKIAVDMIFTCLSVFCFIPSLHFYLHILLKCIVSACYMYLWYVGWSVCRSVCSESVLWQNGWLDLDAIWDDEWGRPRDGCIKWVWWSLKGKENFWGWIWGITL